MIQLVDVTKTFDRFPAVNGATMTVPKGVIYGLLGPNGAGKTTLLKLMAGILRQDRGTIVIDGEEVWENTNVKQRLLFLPDFVYFFPHTTIRQMADFYEQVYPSFSRERFVELQEAFSLDLDKKIQQFSKGMQRQAAFWLAFSVQPDVLIMDEPLDGLDAFVRRHVKQLLIDEVVEREMTIVISSHNLRELEDLCGIVGLMERGTVRLERDLDELRAGMHKLQLAFRDGFPSELVERLDIVHREERGSIVLLVVRGEKRRIEETVRAFHPLILDVLPLSLEEIFMYEIGRGAHV
ncbi:MULTISPECIES: ABC transporter ATP-binding protein [Geobacillus]|jgi:ABC-2 type transport system ATP-binding protein|uniref:ABC transporter ATP-binding protein n=2 Tax=Geobacillus thermodenitrificans TaxID=33940 RepID=A4IND4_GEOTN|nr:MULTISPECIES: ABC transporter ATP-binding protein [Geobacillus]ABO66838.1 ABC transporter ATP-binding protein [Geobacillus thermodenitrificans NG80-2]ARA96815.1 ABC transporter [Geobacillus thermodenitrificans]ARP42605.1 putative ABC transporter ATP-binding protein YhcG [Geobacillus thermodenitrificans]KQB93403.1 ABC transporter [Geobacillus sp. PA-3]MED0661644.1 ABC transporter ATP-binding protein [Geobacillus thermodenitrificans]